MRLRRRVVVFRWQYFLLCTFLHYLDFFNEYAILKLGKHRKNYHFNLSGIMKIWHNDTIEGRSPDGGGIGWWDHFLSYKFIERTIERWTNFTKQLLIASRVHQAPRKATHCLRREVGQNIQDKKGDKRARDGVPSQEGSLNRGSFQSPGNPRTGGLGEVFKSQRAT